MKITSKSSILLLAALPACGYSGQEGDQSREGVSESSSALTNVEPTAGGGCPLQSPTGQVKHIIYIQFDNVHLRRDNPNVPSDLEQMPNLLNFLTSNGTLSGNHHTPLISHTADDIVTSLTGVYGSRHGQPVANDFGYFPAFGTDLDEFTSSFSYWTDVVDPSTPSLDPSFFMVTSDGHNAPAPWVPYTRAGCNFGAVSTANIELENVNGDVNTAFAANPTLLASLQAEVNSDYYQAVADLDGIAVHCAAGDPLCMASNSGVADVLPQEPGGYSGFNALYGHKFVAPQISPSGPLVDLDGNVINDGYGHVGFPGFGSISASQSLAYVAAMQEHGIPVTFAYIADAHDDHAGTYNYRAFGPGEVGYTAQLKAYDNAFGKFFARLAKDGITTDNTLFVITADEGDHFAGGAASPANCDGVTVPCTYVKSGEIDANLTALLDAVDPTLASTPFDIHFDMAPTFYLQGNPTVGAPIARQYERAAAQLTAVSLITGNTDKLTEFLADPVEMKMLHMVTGDPQRTPTFVMFGNPNYYFQTYGTPTLVEDPAYAWNHGGTNHEIVTTWLGLAGPGVQRRGRNDLIWSDHTDIRPTMLLLAGLSDDYAHDGAALVNELSPEALPPALRGQGEQDLFELLRATYKQINAPVADLGMTTLGISTRALAGDDRSYATLEAGLADLTGRRDALAAEMIGELEAAEFGGQPVHVQKALGLIGQAIGLIADAQKLAH
jgi:hypothetical protein